MMTSRWLMTMLHKTRWMNQHRRHQTCRLLGNHQTVSTRLQKPQTALAPHVVSASFAANEATEA